VLLEDYILNKDKTLDRRRFLQYSSAMSVFLGYQCVAPSYVWATSTKSSIAGSNDHKKEIDLIIAQHEIKIGDRNAKITAINQTLPGPLLRLQEGEDYLIRVNNQLMEDSSIHWHGLIVPPNMDGVPGVSYAGIRPGETFHYKFKVVQNGTYWYHSHSGVQEQLGVYGPLIIDPKEKEPFEYDQEYTVLLSDWTFEDPHEVVAKLKKQSNYYNFQQPTAKSLSDQAKKVGWRQAINNRLAWQRMRMDPTDFADVTGYTYSYLMNGLPSMVNWTALFKPGERIRLRFINGSAMSYFDVRIPGLTMRVVQADGQNIQPIDVDEFRIAVAETYDVIVEPQADLAYTIFGEAMDRSGFVRGTLAPRQGMTASIPERRSRPLRTMADMGMGDMEGGNGMNMDSPAKQASAAKDSNMDMGGIVEDNGMNMDSPAKQASAAKDSNMDMSSSAMQTANNALPVDSEKSSLSTVPAQSGMANKSYKHGPDHHQPGTAMLAMNAKSRLGEPGAGLGADGRRVLVYNDLKSLTPGYDQREPSQEIELHLTGNMERYMWSFDGKKYSEAKEPIHFNYGERLRLVFWNDTMMDHPIHLHGMWMELDNDTGVYKPRKHTINVKPAERVVVEVTADAPGKWAFHCHLLYHMDMGMFRVVSVS